MANSIPWKQAKLKQLYAIVFHDPDCPAHLKQAANTELRRRKDAKRANIKYRAMGRNHG